MTCSTRNVRPSSIFMGEYAVVKLGDFGLAKSIAGGGTSASGVTKAGEWKGQANYLPPEQLISEAMVDQRSDIYALGATLYQMVTGAPPYDAASVAPLPIWKVPALTVTHLAATPTFFGLKTSWTGPSGLASSCGSAAGLGFAGGNGFFLSWTKSQ